MPAWIKDFMRRVLLIITLLCCWSMCAMGQSTKPDATGMLKQLLALPAPMPRTTEAPEAKPTPTDKNNPPADDAAIEDLQNYWDPSKSSDGRPEPSTAVKRRLIDAAANDQTKLIPLLRLLDSTDAEPVKELFDRIPSDRSNIYLHKELRSWLIYNSKYFLDELLARASKVKDDVKFGGIDKENDLKTLATLDWPTAEPLIKSLAETGQQRTSTLAISLLYQHAVETGDSTAEDKFRTRLQTIAADKNFAGWARNSAIEALSLTKWSGRDDWYLSLFRDESLINLSDNGYGFSPLSAILFKDADKWIPIMTKLVGSSDRPVQQSAAMCLVRYAIDSPRRDAILPVLRWLSEPDWLPNGDGGERTHFMQKMDELEIPESVPGLLWIIENDESNAKWAARTIGHYKDPRAIPALKKALLQNNDDDRVMILDGLIASGGLTEAEAVDALEKFAAKSMTAEGQNEIYELYYSRDRVPLPIFIGRYLATKNEVPPEIVRAVLARASALRKQNPELARALLRIAEGWPGKYVDLDVINRIAAGTADAETIGNVLERREKLRESSRQELQALIRVGGVAQSIGSILLDDNVLVQTILSSGDQPSQIALLASARLTQTPLPVAVVGPLLKSKNSLLAQAAERYLLVEDSKEAQTLLWKHHPGEGFITGWRENIQLIAGNNFDAMGKNEERLRSELFKENGPLEIFALVANISGDYQHVLRVYSDRAVYTRYEDSARYRERVISKAELSVFKQFVDSNNLEEFGPQITFCHHDCWVSEFLALRKERGRRVFSHQGFGGWMTLIANFDLLGRDGKVHYGLESQIKGLEVLYADSEPQVKDVWQYNDEIRVYTERSYTDEEFKELDKLNNTDDEEEDELAATEKTRRELELFKARFSWRKFSGGKLADVTQAPDVYPAFDYSKFFKPEHELTMRKNGTALRLFTADSIIIARNFDGLWKQIAGSEPVRISGEGGAYLSPVSTADGKWVVTAKTDTNWGAPNYVVRFNLETGREFRVNVEPADDLKPIVYLPAHGKVLLRRARENRFVGSQIGPERPEYYLLAPDTGETQSISGEFAPLMQEGDRFLQASGKADEFWAAIPNEAKDQTQVGRYNLKTFSFTAVLTIPHISFDSMSMWVDEKRGHVYVAYKGQLLSIPLGSPAAVGGN